jgi:hypothetical protein
MPLTLGEVKTAIIVGDLDANLDALKQAIKTREGMKAIQLKSELSIGDTVYFTNKVRPAYMAGAAATVKEINRVRIVVDLVKPAGRFNKNVTVPVELVTTVKP